MKDLSYRTQLLVSGVSTKHHMSRT